MLEATADTNIYISALQFEGVPARFLERARQGAFRLSISEPILDEVRRVLLEKFLWPPEDLDEILADLGTFTTKVAPKVTLAVIDADPDDDRILECAIEDHGPAVMQEFVVAARDLVRRASAVLTIDEVIAGGDRVAARLTFCHAGCAHGSGCTSG